MVTGFLFLELRQQRGWRTMALRADERVHCEQRLCAVHVSRLRHAVVKTAAVDAGVLSVGPRKQDLGCRCACLQVVELSTLKMVNRWLNPAENPRRANCQASPYMHTGVLETMHD